MAAAGAVIADLIVENVVPGSAAYGILSAGDKIVSVDGQIVNSQRDLELASQRAGEIVRVGFIRPNGEECVTILQRRGFNSHFAEIPSDLEQGKIGNHSAAVPLTQRSMIGGDDGRLERQYETSSLRGDALHVGDSKFQAFVREENLTNDKIAQYPSSSSSSLGNYDRRGESERGRRLQFTDQQIEEMIIRQTLLEDENSILSRRVSALLTAIPDVDALKVATQELDAENAKLQEEVVTCRAMNAATRAETAALQKQINELEEMNRRQSSQLDRALQQAENLADQLLLHQNRCAELENKLQSSDEEKKKLEKENDGLRQRLQELEASNVDLQRQCRIHQDRVSHLTDLRSRDNEVLTRAIQAFVTAPPVPSVTILPERK